MNRRTFVAIAIVLSSWIAPNALAQAQTPATPDTQPTAAPDAAAQTSATPATATTQAPASPVQTSPSEPAQATAPTSTRSVSMTTDGLRRMVSWDLSLEGGFGVALDGELPHVWFARARVGALLVSEPFILAFGATGEAGGLSELGAGIQADIMNLWTGLTLQLGAAYTKNESAVVHAGLGYSIFGVEWQHDFADDAESNNAIYFKLRAPIGLIVALL